MLINFTSKIESIGSSTFVTHLHNELALRVENTLSTKGTAIACIMRGNRVVQNADPMEVMFAAEFNVIDEIRRLPMVTTGY
jgi:hypothetical protein